LSVSVAQLEAHHAPLAGWHDARGRVRAVVRVCRLADRWRLVTANDGLEALVKKLRMFVLRSAVTVDVARDVTVAAVLGADAAWLERRGLAPSTPPSHAVVQDGLHWIRVADDYWQVLGTPEGLAPLAAELAAAAPHAIALAEIGLGIPAVGASTAERFVAQMLNLDVLGAVSFDKGCYPGQEIIARVRHLGDVKRRARRYTAASAPPPAGSSVTRDDGTVVGEVVRSTAADGGAELLAVVDHAAAGGELRCGAAKLRELPLPFPVPGATPRA
jgi:folate-binding protein YgfZ